MSAGTRGAGRPDPRAGGSATPADASLTEAQLEGVRRLLVLHVDAGAPRRLSASLLSGGRSNLTYLVTDGRREWVLRRPPLGQVLETAHDMEREFRVMTALAATAVPVPTTIALHRDAGLLGAPFYLMDRVPGSVLRTTAELRAVPAGAVADVADAFIDSLARLHSVDPGEVGLEGFGRPEGYLDRQLRRWGRQLAASTSRDIPGFTELGAALARAVPQPDRTRTASIVHGDHRLDNAVIDLGGPSDTDHGRLPTARPVRIAALLDWEMSTLGDPLADLALSWLYWEGWGGLDNPIAATPADQPGWPAFDRLAERYTRTSGIEPTRTAWYRAFAVYKFAVICEGIHLRHTRGLTAGEGFDGIGAMVAPLVERGRALVAADSHGR